MSGGIRAGLEIRGHDGTPPASWYAVAPSVHVDDVPNRTFFAVLAGHPSRLGLEPLLSLRGLPGDVPLEIRKLYDDWGGEAFDASWVSYDELVTVRQRVTSAIEDVARKHDVDAGNLLKLHVGVSIEAVIAFLGICQAHGFETRMVFWFTPI